MVGWILRTLHEVFFSGGYGEPSPSATLIKGIRNMSIRYKTDIRKVVYWEENEEELPYESLYPPGKASNANIT